VKNPSEILVVSNSSLLSYYLAKHPKIETLTRSRKTGHHCTKKTQSLKRAFQAKNSLPKINSARREPVVAGESTIGWSGCSSRHAAVGPQIIRAGCVQKTVEVSGAANAST
jgi:hypothetical protein